MLLRSDAVSQSPSTAQTWTVLPPGCFASPSGKKRSRGCERHFASTYKPFGTVHAPRLSAARKGRRDARAGLRPPTSSDDRGEGPHFDFSEWLCFSSRGGFIFFIGSARNDAKPFIRQRTLKGLCFIPRRAHPYIELLAFGSVVRKP